MALLVLPGAAWRPQTYRITSSARVKTDCGMSRLRARAVLRLMMISNRVAFSTGSSAGLALSLELLGRLLQAEYRRGS